MAIDDHPKYPEWVTALDELKQAADNYNEALRLGVKEPMLKGSRLQLNLARIRYDKVSSELDAT